ncbi:hypothetical protein N657DRAFT_437411 [Parathielavia appendiculata]|uniref:Uncharacterized protein n=1 Tax=Parathielavia appendiculata TaxID=2587402 RepID=A0AAN6U0A2_9PEZI|nr:hypothetical protein N657DRAFT_437411 [Parathielavia appendiculata]
MAGQRPLDVLPQVVNDVLVTVAKAFRSGRRDGKGNPAAASAAIKARIPPAIEKFNCALDELECELLICKAVLERDLRQLRASRQPPPPEPKQIAPPAPMVIDFDSANMPTMDPFAGLAGHPQPATQTNRPVAPFPNMGFDPASPEVAGVPNPKTIPKLKDGNALNRPAITATAAAVATGSPASTPPKRDAKAPAHQVPRPVVVATAPQTPLHHQTQVKSASVPVLNRQAPTPTPGNAPGQLSTATSTPASSGNEKLFTDMTFSVAPPSGDAQAQTQRRASQQSLQPPATHTPNAEAGHVPNLNVDQFLGGPADVANMGLGIVQGDKAGENANTADVDDKINGLFDLGPGSIENMDLEYDMGNGDNSNFNDMYFAGGESNSGAGEFDDAFFNLNG